MTASKDSRETAPDAAARRSPGRPPTQKSRVIDTALQIVDAEGANALSMRVLAQRLDSGTATLYRHFANRGEVIEQVVDRILGEAAIDAERLNTADWPAACTTFARAVFDALRRHGNVASLLIEHIPTGPNAMAHRELLIAVLLKQGFAPELAARSYATLARYVLGFAIQGTVKASDDVSHSSPARGFGRLDPERFPATVAVADHLPVALEDEFTFGLDLLVDGLTQLRGSDDPTSKSTELGPASH